MTGRHRKGMRIAIVAAAFAGLLGGCAGAREVAAEHPMPGSDQDAHGCKASAGYAWCARTGKCERPWELARERGFDNSAEAFHRYCEGSIDEAAKPPARK